MGNSESLKKERAKSINAEFWRDYKHEILDYDNEWIKVITPIAEYLWRIDQNENYNSGFYWRCNYIKLFGFTVEENPKLWFYKIGEDKLCELFPHRLRHFYEHSMGNFYKKDEELDEQYQELEEKLPDLITGGKYFCYMNAKFLVTRRRYRIMRDPCLEISLVKITIDDIAYIVNIPHEVIKEKIRLIVDAHSVSSKIDSALFDIINVAKTYQSVNRIFPLADTPPAYPGEKD